eukprot:362822-Chlamydomonas_euryale.AAC.32
MAHKKKLEQSWPEVIIHDASWIITSGQLCSSPPSPRPDLRRITAHAHHGVSTLASFPAVPPHPGQICAASQLF